MNREILDELEAVKASLGLVELRQSFEQSEIEKAAKSAKRKRNAVDWFRKELDSITQWKRELAEDLRGVYLFANRIGLQLDVLLEYAEQIGKPDSNGLNFKALAAIEKYRLALMEKQDVSQDEFEKRRQRGLELWNGGMQWNEVAELLDGTPEWWKSVQAEIIRFAKANNLPIRKGKPGAKKKK